LDGLLKLLVPCYRILHVDKHHAKMLSLQLDLHLKEPLYFFLVDIPFAPIGIPKLAPSSRFFPSSPAVSCAVDNTFVYNLSAVSEALFYSPMATRRIDEICRGRGFSFFVGP
jgi:hypothetical protein